jgi:16S rRNA (guanine966-N2)-methyltransferase
MRIIGGIAGGALLKVPKGYDVRPTPDLVRQAVFNSLGNRVESTRVLELFAGTGALSLECLSRGALSAVCVEKSPRHAQFIRRNLISAGLPSHLLHVRAQDAFTAIHQLDVAGQSFDLILADPPFGPKNRDRRSSSPAQRLLDDTHLPSLLAETGLFILGHAYRDTLAIASPWNELKRLRHGDSVMLLLERAAGSPPMHEGRGNLGV